MQFCITGNNGNRDGTSIIIACEYHFNDFLLINPEVGVDYVDQNLHADYGSIRYNYTNYNNNWEPLC